MFLQTGQSIIRASNRFLKKSDSNIERIRKIYNEWNECMMSNVDQMAEQPVKKFWDQLIKPIQFCEQNVTGIKNMKLIDADEINYSLTPRVNQEKYEIVTVGIGQDVSAELELLKKIGAENVNFYGADPITSGNENLYTGFGKFFPVAVGNVSNVSESSALVNGERVKQIVKQVEFIHFLKDLVGITVFDNIWIDGEGAEYLLFDYFFKNGKLDDNGITICQFNMEIHQPDDRKKSEIRRFLLKIFDDRRYVFLRPIQATHLRLYFINFLDEKCISKYYF